MLHISSWCNWSLVCWNWESIHQWTIERCTYLYTHVCAYEISRILHVCLIKISVFIFWCACNCLFGQNMEGLVTYTTGNIFSQFLIFHFNPCSFEWIWNKCATYISWTYTSTNVRGGCPRNECDLQSSLLFWSWNQPQYRTKGLSYNSSKSNHSFVDD